METFICEERSLSGKNKTVFLLRIRTNAYNLYSPAADLREKETPVPEESSILPKTVSCTFNAVFISSGMSCVVVS